MSAETALRLQAARDHLALAAEELAAINAGSDGCPATETATVQANLALSALGMAIRNIPAGLLLPAATPSEAVA